MNDVIGYLKSIFKNKITFLYNEYERNMPLYLTEQFVFLKFKIDGNDNKYILTEFKEKIEIKINTIRKQISQIKKFSSKCSIPTTSKSTIVKRITRSNRFNCPISLFPITLITNIIKIYKILQR